MLGGSDVGDIWSNLRFVEYFICVDNMAWRLSLNTLFLVL